MGSNIVLFEMAPAIVKKNRIFKAIKTPVSLDTKIEGTKTHTKTYKPLLIKIPNNSHNKAIQVMIFFKILFPYKVTGITFLTRGICRSAYKMELIRYAILKRKDIQKHLSMVFLLQDA